MPLARVVGAKRSSRDMQITEAGGLGAQKFRG